jgi:hypothetical protein
MVPNGTQLAGSGKRRAIYMANLKAQGLKPGVSDIVIAYPVDTIGRLPTGGGEFWHGAYIELKRVREAYKGPAGVRRAVRPEQLEWLQLMDSVGYWADVAYGREEFKAKVLSYLRGESPTPLDSEGNLVHDDRAQ